MPDGRRRGLLAVVVLAVLLASCGGPPTHNKDPRKGRVYTTWSNCAWGACVSDWKVCVGPDLLLSIGGDQHTVQRSEECHD